MCFDGIHPLALLQFLPLPTLASRAILFKPPSLLSVLGCRTMHRSTARDRIPQEKSLCPNSHPLPRAPQLAMDGQIHPLIHAGIMASLVTCRYCARSHTTPSPLPLPHGRATALPCPANTVSWQMPIAADSYNSSEMIPELGGSCSSFRAEHIDLVFISTDLRKTERSCPVAGAGTTDRSLGKLDTCICPKMT